jgi:hypothetical protein
MSIACPSLIANYSPTLCAAVINYCERSSAALNAEPINALTNAAFLVAAWGTWRLLSRHPSPQRRGLVWALISTMVIVGLGSFLFHTVATRWAEWGDVLPIMVFMLLYLWLVLTRFLRWRTWLKLIALGVYFAATFYLEAAVPSTVLWGGALYLPTILLMIAMGTRLYWQRSRAAAGIVAATVVFLLSFSARTLDAKVCPVLPIGTHFMWHLLNATLLYILMRVAVLYSDAGAGKSLANSQRAA